MPLLFDTLFRKPAGRPRKSPLSISQHLLAIFPLNYPPAQSRFNFTAAQDFAPGKGSSPMANQTRISRRAATLLLLTAMAGPHHAAAAANGPSDGSHLDAVIILSRHGVRSPLQSTAKLNEETSATWPEWNVPPGHLTPRGRKLMVKMGGYYRDRFTSEGLLTGNDAQDAAHAYVHANVIQRTVQTGCALAEGLFPSTTTTVHRLGEKQKDALFYGAEIDPKLKSATINGRISNNIADLMDSLAPQIALIENAIGHPGIFGRKLSSLSLLAAQSDSFMLQYCEGLPMSQVAFGKANKDQLQEIFKISEVDFDLMVRTPYLARQRMSNLVGHIAATLDAVANGTHTNRAFGDADDRLFIISGHDTTVCSVAALLRLEWVLPDVGRNLCTPGGALVFELRSRGSEKFVRTYFAGQTLDQMRENANLSIENPPAIAPIFVPGASQPDQYYDAPLADFQAAVAAAIDEKLIVPVDDGK
jgi:4-phytase/acid phosphatase